MRILLINLIYGSGSTGKICFQLKHSLEKNGNKCAVVCGDSTINGNDIYVTQPKWLHYVEFVLGRFRGKHDLGCYIQTKSAIRFIKKFNPDVIHLHSIHSDYINFKMLFGFFKKIGKPIIWTLHDCWAFTGHCANYSFIGCNNWKNKCIDCLNMQTFPRNLLKQKVVKMLDTKIKCISGFNRLIITTPSKWLAKEIGKTYLNQYDIKVVNNGIDLSVFKPYYNANIANIRRNYKYTILAVGSPFGYHKGLEYMNYLAKELSNDYQIIVIGYNGDGSDIDKRIVIIKRTENMQELAEYYSAADCFVNPTLQDNFPTVNMESLACGTPIAAFEVDGACEVINEKVGLKVKYRDKEDLKRKVMFICENNLFKKTDCINVSQNFSNINMISNYIKLYNELYGK